MRGGTEPTGVRVAVVDRAPAYRRGLELAFSEAGYRVEQPADMSRWAEASGVRALVATCRSASEARRLALARARGTDTVAVALLGDDSSVAYREVLETGVESAVARDASLDHIVEVVDAAVDRRTVLPTEVARSLARGDGDDESVEDQQAEWLRALARGATVEELAESVGYSERAMYRQLRRLYERLGATNRTEALLQALRRGLID
jgi:DNA-binding NarL/FixJ family response regulator